MHSCHGFCVQLGGFAGWDGFLGIALTFGRFWAFWSGCHDSCRRNVTSKQNGISLSLSIAISKMVCPTHLYVYQHEMQQKTGFTYVRVLGRAFVSLRRLGQWGQTTYSEKVHVCVKRLHLQNCGWLSRLSAFLFPWGCCCTQLALLAVPEYENSWTISMHEAKRPKCPSLCPSAPGVIAIVVHLLSLGDEPSSAFKVEQDFPWKGSSGWMDPFHPEDLFQRKMCCWWKLSAWTWKPSTIYLNILNA